MTTSTDPGDIDAMHAVIWQMRHMTDGSMWVFVPMTPPCPPPISTTSAYRDTLLSALRYQRDHTQSQSEYDAAVAALQAMGETT